MASVFLVITQCVVSPSWQRERFSTVTALKNVDDQGEVNEL